MYQHSDTFVMLIKMQYGNKNIDKSGDDSFEA